jgi:hypothetical protein
MDVAIQSDGKVSPMPFLTKHDAMQAYRGCGGIAPRIP